MNEGQPIFATTRWSVVMAAGAPESPQARDALAQLCEHSWFPLYAFLRRRGHPAEEAQDLTQGFFADLLERGDIARADPARGRFRSFMLGALKNYVANQKLRSRAQKRGAGEPSLSFEWERAEGLFALEPVDQRTPESIFTANWARSLLGGVMEQLEGEYERRGKSDLYLQLAPCLGGSAEALPYGDIAESLGASEGTVRVGVHRLRKRFRELLCAEIRETLEDGGDVQAEIRDLFQALGGE